MRWTAVALLAFIPLCLAQDAVAEEKPIVAVFEIQVKGFKLRNVAVKGLTEYLCASLSEGGRYSVLPSSEIRKVLLEKSRESHKKCYDQRCQIEIGRALAANKTLSTSIYKLGKQCYVTMQVFDLKSQTADKAKKARGKCTEDGLVKAIDEVARALSGVSTGRARRAGVADKAPSDSSSGNLDAYLEKVRRKKDQEEKRSKKIEETWAFIRRIARDPTEGHETKRRLLKGFIREYSSKNPHLAEAKRVLSDIMSGRVTVNTEPSGVMINVEGLKSGLSPLTFEARAGSYNVIASHKRYKTVERQIQVEPSSDEVLSIEMEMRPGKVFIKCVPKGALLYQENERLGRCPFKGALKPGEKTIRAELEGYAPTTKRFTVTPGQKIGVVYKLDKARGTLAVQSVPSNAHVKIDDRPYGKTPISLVVAAGRHEVVVEKDGHFADSKLVAIEHGKKTNAYFELARIEPGRLSITSIPDGAGIKIDGKEAGKTPKEGRVEPGDYAVEVSMEGYVTDKKTAQVVSGKMTNLVFELKKVPPGRLFVETVPQDAHLSVGGRWLERGEREIELERGRYKVIANAEGYAPRNREVVIRSQQTERIRLVLREIPAGTLEISAKPAETVIELDGEVVGKSPIIKKLPPGKHVVVAKMEDYREKRIAVAIEDDQEKRLDIELERIPKGTMRLSSSPGGSKVLLDGEVIGKTPLTKVVECGRYDIELEKRGYEGFRESIEVRDQETTEVSARLERIEELNARIKTIPPGARVVIDGEYVGDSPVEAKLGIGEHRVVASAENRIDTEMTIEVEVDGDNEFAIDMNANDKGLLIVKTMPAGARIQIGDEEIGTSPAEKAVAPGQYSIAVSRDGYKMAQRQVSVSRNLKKEVMLHLEPAIEMDFEEKLGHTLFWTGLGFAGLGAMAAFKADAAADEFKAHSWYTNADSRSKEWAAGMYTGLIGGGAMMIGGIVFWILSPSDEEIAQQRGLSLGAGAGKDRYSISLVGSW